MSHIKDWKQLKEDALWNEWRALHDSDTAAIARAIWTANRLVKQEQGISRDQKGAFYSFKDHFIWLRQNDLIEGRVARVEKEKCGVCEGDGTLWQDGPKCPDCKGTGIGSRIRRTLYQHDFLIEGQRYSFHSYVKPQCLLDERGADLPQYGTEFTPAELRQLPLPFKGLLNVLRHVATSIWHLTLDRGQYGPRDVAHARRIPKAQCEAQMLQWAESEIKRQERPWLEPGAAEQEYIPKTWIKPLHGLTDSLVAQLGEPDCTKVNPRYRCASPLKLYSQERIRTWKAEHADLVEKAAARSAAATRKRAMNSPGPDEVRD